ncbi:phospho-N-acetylmuramoyl-pentapeptide-transferase [Succinispira mobilis]|uniref:phospho-N-acetylmuramoyl-pentapeptide- transferase n=1 Tax=Succinispira mobilis TaxID=78120 RepID=UPI0003618DEE|nr:phospho-N-acetylmuramoyl-pentapeptide-transferase [Succinispira mobilis]
MDILLFLQALVLAIALVLALGPQLIPFLHKLKFGQSIREVGPSTHLKKAGTPTMGGILFVPAIMLPTIFLTSIDKNVILVMLLFLGHFILGFLDDYIKVVLKRNLGLKAKEKILGQLLIAMIFGYFVDQKPLWIPLLNLYWDMGVLYYPFVFLVIIGTTNAVNLTDGLDGLLAGTTLPVALAYFIIAYSLVDTNLAIIAISLLGACLAFLKFNSYPAKVFMGDTGSLAIGGVIAGLALVTNTTLLLIILGGIYVIEALSVIAQVTSFKLTGQRILKMSPIHHHFELIGWREIKVVRVFVFLNIFFALLGVAIFWISRC